MKKEQFKNKFIRWRNRFGDWKGVINVDGNKVIYNNRTVWIFLKKELEEFNKLTQEEQQQFLSDLFNFYIDIQD